MWRTLEALFGLRNPNFGGGGWVILPNLFNPSCGFRVIQDWFCPKMFFWKFPIPKPLLWSKSFRSMTLPNKVLGPKKFLGTPQNEKNWFSQKNCVLGFGRIGEILNNQSILWLFRCTCSPINIKYRIEAPPTKKIEFIPTFAGIRFLFLSFFMSVHLATRNIILSSPRSRSSSRSCLGQGPSQGSSLQQTQKGGGYGGWLAHCTLS